MAFLCLILALLVEHERLESWRVQGLLASRTGAGGVGSERARACAVLRVLAYARAIVDVVEPWELDHDHVCYGMHRRAGELSVLGISDIQS